MRLGEQQIAPGVALSSPGSGVAFAAVGLDHDALPTPEEVGPDHVAAGEREVLLDLGAREAGGVTEGEETVLEWALRQGKR